MIDGLDISTLTLKRLRQSVAFVPQDPILFQGTIRSNLDPFGLYEDGKIWKALQKVTMGKDSATVSNLDMPIEEGGRNFSQGELIQSLRRFCAHVLCIGQRQLLALARGILKLESTSILILDESTASLGPSPLVLFSWEYTEQNSSIRQCNR